MKRKWEDDPSFQLTNEFVQSFVGGQCLIDELFAGHHVIRGEIAAIYYNAATRDLNVQFVWVSRLDDGVWVNHDTVQFKRRVTLKNCYHTKTCLGFTSGHGDIELDKKAHELQLPASRILGLLK